MHEARNTKTMPLPKEKERIKQLLAESITVLCKNSLNYQEDFTIEGLLGITLDSSDVFLININQQLKVLVPY